VENRIIDNPHTVATAIRIGNPASWQSAVEAARDSGGKIDKVTDEEILHAYQLISRTEGIFVEPACAAPLAGLIKCHQQGLIPDGSLITATLTGHGLKDPDTAISVAAQEIHPVEPRLEAVLEAIGC